MLRAPLLVRRATFLLLGTLAVAASAGYVLGVAPGTLGPDSGHQASIQEHIHAWMPEDGWHDGVRTRTLTMMDTPEGVVVDERITGIHGPRGDHFALAADRDFQLVGEPGVRAVFPPSPPLQNTHNQVYLGVPWEQGARAAVGAIDAFVRAGTEERHGLELVRYEARHTRQFFVVEDQAWFRSAYRIAWVDPWTGTVVDHFDHETLWRMKLHNEVPLLPLTALLSSPEKVWEATSEPTDESVAAQADHAREARTDYYAKAATGGVPLLLFGELLLWLAIVQPRATRR